MNSARYIETLERELVLAIYDPQLGGLVKVPDQNLASELSGMAGAVNHSSPQEPVSQDPVKWADSQTSTSSSSTSLPLLASSPPSSLPTTSAIPSGQAISLSKAVKPITKAKKRQPGWRRTKVACLRCREDKRAVSDHLHAEREYIALLTKLVRRSRF
jgi:hypothetical protein